MEIGGFQKISLLDYPGKISSIIFTIGCDFRCPFCYVPQLVLPERIKEVVRIPKEYVLSYLKENKKFLDAVVITGGEPTIHFDLPQFTKEIKSLGFLVAIETNGSNFQMLKYLIDNKLVDYVEVDIKNVLDFEKYNKTVGNVLTREMFENVKNTIKFLLKGFVDYEFRTTILKEFHEKKDIVNICRFIKGAKAYYLQNLKNNVELICGKKLTPFKDEEIEEIINECKKFVNIAYRKG
jgi:pyruvate formate lyase activating enzyme